MLVWSLVAASAVFWALRMFAQSIPVPAGAGLAADAPVMGADLSRLLGAAPPPAVEQVAAPPPQANRFRLTGVVATASDRTKRSGPAPGIALISVDGSPPKAYRVGDLIDSRLALVSVALRSASLGDRAAPGNVDFVLELPPPSAPATGRLTYPSGAGAPPPVTPMAFGQAAAPAAMPAPPGDPTQGMPVQMAPGNPQQRPMPSNQLIQKLPQMAPGVQALPPGGQWSQDGVPTAMPTGEARTRSLSQ